MADLGTISILVDSSQVRSAKEDVQDLGNSYNSAAKSASVFMQTFAKAAAQSAKDAQYLRDVARANQEIINTNLKVSNSYMSAEDSAAIFARELRAQELQAQKTARANQEIINTNLRVSNSYMSAEDSAAIFTRELRAQELQAQKTARANQDAINKQLGVNKPSAVSAGAGFGAIEAEILRLESMYNKVAVAARVYEQVQESLNRAVMLGVLTTDEKEAKLQELSVAYQKVGNDAGKAQTFINQFGENAQVSGRGLNKFGMIAQQVGYQVGDFFVQIQSGTNVFVAFGQQATQLAGLIPGVAGAIAGIGISLVTALLAFNDRANQAKETTNAFTEALDSLKNSTQNLRVQLESLKLGVSSEEAALILEAKNLEEERLQVLKSISDQTKVLRQDYGATERDIRQALFAEYERLSVLEQLLQEKNKEIDANREAAKALKDAESAGKLSANYIRLIAERALDSAEKLKDAAKSAEALKRALSAASAFSSNLDANVAQLSAQLEEARGKQGAVLALTIQQMEAEARLNRSRAVAAGEDALTADARLAIDLAQIDRYKELQQSIESVETSTKRSGTSAKKALGDAEKAAEALRKETEGPLVNAVQGLSNAWGDFVVRGFKDFKGFASSVLNIFKSMIAQMIATAVANPIMIGMGLGGSVAGGMAGGAMAGAAGGAAAGGLLSGIGTGIAGFGGGLSASLGIGGYASAGLFNVGANAAVASAATGAGAFATTLGAAMPLIGVGLALFSLFRKKPIIKPEDLKKVNDALDMTGQKLNLTGKEAQIAARELGKLAGGFDELSKKANFFFENFYTVNERQAKIAAKAQGQLNKVFEDLGISIPQTHEEFRQLVEAQDLTTESGREMYTALLNVSSAFVTLRGSADQAAQALAMQSAAVNEATAQRKLNQYFDREFQARDIENVGTTLEQNDYLMNQMVEDYNRYVERFNENLKGLSEIDAPRLKPIDRQTLESMTDIDERLGEALNKTSSIQSTLLTWYAGVRKTEEEISNAIVDFTGNKLDASRYKRYGDLPAGFLEKFGKYFMFDKLPYILEVTQFVNEQIIIFEGLEDDLRTTLQGLGKYADAWNGIGKAMADLNASLTSVGPNIANAGEIVGRISGIVISAFESIRKGYEKITEATDKIRTFFSDEFSALAQEYNKDTSLTQSTKIVDRVEKILQAPVRLLDRLDVLMKKLDKKSDVAYEAVRSTEQTILNLTASGQEVSKELRESYSRMEGSFKEAREAGRKAAEEIQKIRLFIDTVGTATKEFISAVEKMTVAPIEEGLKFFEPKMFSEMGDNIRRGLTDIFTSLSEGGYESFERGFVQLTDLLASEAITIDQFNKSFKIMRDVFLGNISLTEAYTTRQQEVVQKLSNAYGKLTDVLNSALSVVRNGIEALLGQLRSADVVANRRTSTAYLQSVARTGQFDATRLESAVGAVTSGDITGFGTRQEFARYVAITTQLLQSVEGTLGGQLNTLQMQQVKAILNIQDTSESASESLQSISQLLSEFLGVGGRIPAFAAGGYHSGGLRIVGENGPEIEATGPSRIISNRQLSLGSDPELRHEVAQMRADLNTALVQIAKNTRKSADTLNKFDYQGLPKERNY